ncbi:hypothetical protein B0H11DRAFT_523607 [Mycena galericulata]|nr:hypothetical protein B0H11DRAFT_523607 [Mycena galericulata]
MIRCIHRRTTELAFHLPFITITSIFPCTILLYQHERDTLHAPPRDRGVLLAAPRSGDVHRRRDVRVPCNDYFFDFAFIAVIFYWDGLRIRPLSSSPLLLSLSSLLVFHVIFFFFLCNQMIFVTDLFFLMQPLRPTISARANSFTTGAETRSASPPDAVSFSVSGPFSSDNMYFTQYVLHSLI